MPKVLGAGASPFVRKVRLALAEKGIPYEHEMMMPGQTPRHLHPMGKVPVYLDGERAIPDSSVICAYLERVHPAPPLYPADPYDYARALWLEEYADSELASKVTGVLFFQRILAPRFFGRATDEALVEKAIGESAPVVFDYLEGQVRGSAPIVGDAITIADLALGSQFVNVRHGGLEVDGGRWPKLRAYVDALLARPSFQSLVAEDAALLGG